MSKALVWFRNDLRIKDNLVLSHAMEKHDEVYAIYCFNPADYGQLEIGLPKIGSYRGKFLLETLADLQKSLKTLGGDITYLIGDPVDLVTRFVADHNIKHVYVEKSSVYQEVRIEENLEKTLWSKGISLDLIWQSTLFHVDDIPWPIKHLPEVFTEFRKELESTAQVRPETAISENRHVLRATDRNELPSLGMLGIEEPNQDSRQVIDFHGGETQAWKRLKYYFWESDLLASYKSTRNGLVGADYSSKFSPWLALGAISPKSIYYEVKKYEQERRKNDSTYWLYFELLWRDFFKFVAKKYGSSLFHIEGIRKREIEYFDDMRLFENWAEGRTGEPFVDANMIELKRTGFMSNRGRQNVASYLVNDLQVNWTWGAQYFQSLLIDYDPASNWGNWNYLAGVGNDPRQDRYFNIQAQAERYDPKGEFVNLWTSPLADLS